ncbi:MAG TPA: cysteine hydrolase [Candidatus Acidoferrales bacterium]|nr:cysteine hydrolase [Candidatus Acidoferrales bacterium]
MAVDKHNSPVVLWEVDTQSDFMLPGGKLYVPGAEKRIPNMRRLVEAARKEKAFLISSTDQHSPNDPEFQRFPPHCVRGTSGADIVPDLKAGDTVHVKNTHPVTALSTISRGKQIVIEKQTLDVFDNPATEKLLAQLPPDSEFIVFGVVTEFCVRLAAKGLLDRGRRVAIVTDAIETLDPDESKKTLDELASHGAELITTSDALQILERSAAPA